MSEESVIIKQLQKELSEMKKELAETKKRAEEYLNGWKRARADYINREKEIEKEKEDWQKFANLSVIFQLLPILDNFKRAFRVYEELRPNLEKGDLQEMKAWVEGIRQIKKQLENLFKALEIEEIKTIGEKFDPFLHESVGVQEGSDSTDKSEIIVKEIEPGYKLHGRVIRPAKVIVSKGK